jgi:hypothetical protein
MALPARLCLSSQLAECHPESGLKPVRDPTSTETVCAVDRIADPVCVTGSGGIRWANLDIEMQGSSSLDFARDFGSGLGRPLSASTSTALPIRKRIGLLRSG